jgi:hypothetical protein
VLEVVGNVLHGQVFELDGSGNEVAMVAEKMRDIDAQPPGMDDYNFDGVDEDFVPYTSGFSGGFGVGSFLAADADFTIDNFRTETVAGLAGDFDKSGVVDSVDLAQWKGDYGANADSDTNGDGVTDGADFLIWQRNPGATSASAAAAGVPEPASLVVACVAACGIFSARRRLGG